MRAPRLRTGHYYDFSQSPALVKYVQRVALSTTLNLAPVDACRYPRFSSSNIHYVWQDVREPPSQGANQHWIDASCTRLRLALKRKEPAMMRQFFSYSLAGAGQRLS